MTDLGRKPVAQLRQLLRTHYQLSVDTAGGCADRTTEEQQLLGSALSDTVLTLFAELDAAEAGRAVTACSVGTNALRADTDRFRRISDDVIADYLTTGRYHESHEAFVTMSLLFEQWLRAMADATTEQHDILDDAVSSNTRIVANVGRGLAYYAQRIATLPQSSFENVVDVLAREADPGTYGRILSALFMIHNRVRDTDPQAQVLLHTEFWKGVDTQALEDAIVGTAATVSAGIAANPAVKRALRRATLRGIWTVAKQLLR